MEKDVKKTAATPKYATGNCESCEFYDFDEEWGEYVCSMSLDEDEMIRFISGKNSSCPYFKYYDEYKSVHKQI